MRWNKKPSIKLDKTETTRTSKRGVVGYSRKSALLEEAITQMNAGKYGRASAALKELLALDPVNMEARRLFAALHLRLGSLIPAREAFDTLITEALQRQDYWLAESLLREYLAAGPRCVPYLEKLGMIYQEKGNALEAVEEYGKAVDILTEDPDPERPDQAARLYAKIRELAPASPVAFRLASFFDAETGEFVISQPSSRETTATLQPDVLEEDAEWEQTASSRVDGAMPWEVLVPSEGLEPSAEPAPSSEHSIPAAQSETRADSLQPVLSFEQGPVRSEGAAANLTESIGLEPQPDSPEETSVSESRVKLEVLAVVVAPSAEPAPSSEHSTPTAQLETRADLLQSVESSDQDLVQSGEVAADQEEPIDIDAQHDLQAAISNQEDGIVPVTEEIGRFAEQEVMDAAQPSPESEDTGAEIAVVSLDAPLDIVAADSAAFQVPEPVSPEIPETTALLEGSAASGAMGLASEQTVDSSADVSESIAELGPSSLFQADRQAPLSPSRTEPADSESREVSNEEEILLQTDKIESPEAEELSSSTDLPRDSAPVLADEMDQPWKQPGFSWKSVFDTAWKFGESSPAKDASTSSAPTRLNEIVADPPLISSPQDRLVEDAAGSTLKQERERLNKDEETLGLPMTPMPGDHVQGAMLSTPLIQTDSPIAEPLAPPVDQAQEPGSALPAPEKQLESSLSINGLDPETASFSFVQDVPTVHSEERHDSAVETRALSTTAQGAKLVAESAPAFSILRSLQTDEPIFPASQEPEPQASTQDPGLGMGVEQQEAPARPADLAARLEQTHSGSGTEEVGQSRQADLRTQHLQLVDEVVSEKIEIVRRIEPAPIERSMTESIVDDGGVLPESQGTSQALLHDDQPPEVVHVQTRSPISESMPHHQARMEVDLPKRASGDPAATSVTSARPAISDQQEVSQPLPAAHVVDEMLVESSRIRRASETRTRVDEPTQRHKPTATLNGLGIAIIGFLRSGFSTTQAIVRTLVGLAVLLGVCVAIGLGALALTWMIMEESPSPTFRSFTTTPQQTLSGAQKNAYTLLVGIDAPVGQDPLRVGAERQSAIGDSPTALSCFGAPGPETGDRSSASASTMRGWVRGSDPIGQLKSQQGTIQGWGNRHQVALERYRQWQKLPFEDWGYGQPVSPPCGAMVFAHQLHVADGLVQGGDIAVDRLETDMEMWRVVLSQARTLPVKMLALQAINDDIALASGMLVRPDFDAKHLGRITKFVRPLDHGELSLRWPMQSELVSAGKTYESQIKAARAEGQAISAMVASALPLPKQRRLNAYAKYYEASYHATGEKQYSALPKWKDHMRFPAAGVMDYLANPIENLVGVDPLPAWDVYSGMMVDTDAHLKLASLQTWLRRGPSEGDLPNKIAKAGQNFYDPYTGLPMLVNLKKGLLYSVGHDGKDQDADPQVDVVVEIPVASTAAGHAKSSSSSAKPR